MTTSATYKPAAQAASPFRTRAWVQSWVDVWGNHPRIKLIDLGGRRDPLEMVYTINHKLKGIIPVKSLVIAGNGFADFDPPRAEYNDLESLVQLAGGMDCLLKELTRLSWNQWALTDFHNNDSFNELVATLSIANGLASTKTKLEMAYRISSSDINSYKKQLSASTRAKYFNRRAKLAEHGIIEVTELTSAQDLFNLLNHFHQMRWGRPCYSAQSMTFFRLFLERIRCEGGVPMMQSLQIAGETVSVLFDLVWNGVRYNIQSGFLEGRFPQLALGSIHLGFAIEQALNDALVYDLLVGQGKNTNYKQQIATENTYMSSVIAVRGWLKSLYRIYGK